MMMKKQAKLIERKIKTSGMDSFREKLFAVGISKNAAELITSAKRQSLVITNWLVESEIAGAVGNKLILLMDPSELIA